MITLINNDFREVLPQMDPVRMIFADPPDNINLGYGEYSDRLSDSAYFDLLRNILFFGADNADVVWISYNAAHTYLMGHLIFYFLEGNPDWEAKPCVQVFTFGQHNQRDLGNNHRPLARLMRKGTTLYPDAIRVPSWRQLHGDKRADPRGRVPGDVFDFPRVTGNSKQRRRWHPTQLNELLYERCIRLTCKPTDTVLDIFAGTGTMARVCAVTENPCVLIDVDPEYCKKIAEEHELISVSEQEWRSNES
jgi:DNA modification methylase